MTISFFFKKNTKTKMTALARSVDLEDRWTHLKNRMLISLLGIEVATATVDQKYIGQGRQLVSVAKLQRGIAQTKV